MVLAKTCSLSWPHESPQRNSVFSPWCLSRLSVSVSLCICTNPLGTDFSLHYSYTSQALSRHKNSSMSAAINTICHFLFTLIRHPPSKITSQIGVSQPAVFRPGVGEWYHWVSFFFSIKLVQFKSNVLYWHDKSYIVLPRHSQKQ